MVSAQTDKQQGTTDEIVDLVIIKGFSQRRIQKFGTLTTKNNIALHRGVAYLRFCYPRYTFFFCIFSPGFKIVQVIL